MSEPTTPDLRLVLAAALHATADDITDGLPIGRLPRLHLGVVDRAELQQWADHLDVDIVTDAGSGIPHVDALIPLSDDRYGPSLAIQVQAPPAPSEVERLRAELAALRAQVGGAS